MYVVTGASGRTGAAVAAALLDAAVDVTVVVRDAAKGERWRERGARVAVVASPGESTELARLLADARGAYLLNPPAYRSADPTHEARATGIALAQAVKTSEIDNVVLLSSLGAGASDGTGIVETNHVVEAAFAAAGVSATFARAAFFMQNFGSVVDVARTRGTLPTFLSPLDRAIPMISTDDVGRLCAALLRNGPPPLGLRVVDLVGPQSYAPLDVAAELAHLFDRPVDAVVVPRDAWVGTIVGNGFSPVAAEGLAAMYDALAAGRIGPTPEVETHVGRVTLATALAALAAPGA